ncbi:MAG: cytochrome c peroxidase [Methylocystis sp.]
MRGETTRAATILAFASALFACAGSMAQEQAKPPLGLPPVPPAIAGSAAMQRLGERLFFDRGLSANKTLSCAMCHIPTQGFTSNQSALSIGMEGRSLRRNAPTLYNVVFKKFLFHDGRETDLAAQVWGPLLSPDEMGNPAIGPLLDRLRADAVYGPAFAEAFPGEGVSMTTLGRAIAAFEATLLTGDSRFDRALFAGEKGALTPLEWRGYEIFVSKGNCVSCHAIGDNVALFTDQSWHNTGVAFADRAATTARVELAPGIFQNIRPSDIGLSATPAKNDVGRFEITGKPEDRWAYTTPTLRGLKETWPYMHDGGFKSLEEVVDFYDLGGGSNPALDPKIKPLGLSDQEKKALVAFLLTL